MKNLTLWFRKLKVLVMKFKIENKVKEEVIFRNIRFPKELFDKINQEKGSISYTQFVLQACKFALDNMDKK